MRYLTLGEVLELHHHIVESWSGAEGILDLRAPESAVGLVEWLRGHIVEQ